ncbi:serine/threonine-protein phosphatase 6 regulatory ankyrin repeat subunit B-like isoform X2 [Oscarella lobularis]|uniref:serine/threonine-protein phosphatase 6 regulatory ankyrin repeat subunit B-like isoform X2 n=1 Tax=Oscarella lobularis TaxID=121494 RepID=UPI0033136649
MDLLSQLEKAAAQDDITKLRSLIQRGASQHCNDALLSAILIAACRRGDEDLVKWVVSEDCNRTAISASDRNGKTALYYACERGHRKIAVYLISECGANANKTSKRGQTILMAACEGGDEDLARLVVSKGCNVNAKDLDKNSALYYAVINGHGKAAAYLVTKCGANVNDRNNLGRTILMAVCETGDESLVRLIVPKGCDVNARARDERTALYSAVARGHRIIAEYLISECEANVNNEDHRGKTILMAACARGDESLVRLIVSKGCHINARARDKRTALCYAATEGHGIIAAYLISECGANVNERYEWGKTILMAACEGGDESLARSIVSKGFDVNARDEERTALYYATTYGRLQIAAYLIRECGADVNERLEFRNGKNILITACEGGDEDLARLVVSKGCDVNAKDRYENSALYYAVVNGRRKVAAYLITECGANVNDRNNLGRTILMAVCARGDKSLVRLIVSKGCDVNARSRYKETALYYAATMGHGLIAKYLISECEANVNCEDHWGKTILMAACARGDESLVRSIVSKGFDVNARDEDKRTALYYATTYGRLQIAAYLIRVGGADVNERLKWGKTILMAACARGDESLVRLIVSKGCDVNARDEYKETALYYAVAMGHGIIAKYLISECEANVNNEDHWGKTILMAACEGGDASLVRLIVSKGCDVNARAMFKETALYCAVAKGHGIIAEYLISECEANVNNEDHWGKTILMATCEGGDESLVRLIVSKGCHVNARNGDKKTALYYAATKGHGIISSYLISECGANVNNRYESGKTILMAACEGGDENLVRSIVSKGFVVNARDENEKTALHYAVTKGHGRIAAYLINECRANVNERCERGKTILMAACEGGDESLVRLIVSKGCHVNARARDKRTALYYAATKGHRIIAAYLVSECGANVNERYENAVSPLMYACQTGNLKIAGLLVAYDCDVNATDVKGNSPLSIAMMNRNWNLVKFLISSGFKLDMKWGTQMQTVLHRLAMLWYEDECLQLAKEVVGRMPALADCRDLNAKVPFELGDGEMKKYLVEAWRECRYRKLFEKGRKKPSRVKVCLIGNGGAGKTTLMNSLRRISRTMSPDARTAGVDIITATIDSAGELIFCDFAGQPTFHKTHGLFFSEATTIFVLVVDLTMSEEELDKCAFYWLSFVKCSIRMKGKAMLVVVGSRGDQDSGEKLTGISNHLRIKFKKWFTLRQHFVLDCREQESVRLQKLREYIGSLKQECIKDADEVPTIVETVQSSLLPQVRDLLLKSEGDALKEMAEKNMLPQALFKLINCSDGDPIRMLENLKAPHYEDIYSEINSTLQNFGLTTLQLAKIERQFIHVGLLKALVEKNVYPGLKCEELDLLVAFLHGIGEILVVENQVVLDPPWLCQSIIGPLMSPGDFTVHLEGVVNGIVSKDQVKDALELFSEANQTGNIAVDEAIKVLCHLEICYPVSERPGAPVQYQFPALIQTVDRERVWQRKEDMVLYVGRRLQCKEKTDIITPGTMPFIQSRAAIKLHPKEPVVWKGGLKMQKTINNCRLEGLIELHEYEKSMDFVVRGPQDSEGECMTLLNEIMKLGQTVLEEKSAGTDLSLLYLSKTELQKLSVQPLAYASETVEEEKKSGKTTTTVFQAERGQDLTAESLKDLLAVPEDHYLLVLKESRRAIADSLNKDTVDRRTAFAKALPGLTASSYAQCRSAEDVLARWSESLCSTVSKLEEAATKANVLYILAILEDGGAIQLSDETRTRAEDALFRLEDAQKKADSASGGVTINMGGASVQGHGSTASASQKVDITINQK